MKNKLKIVAGIILAVLIGLLIFRAFSAKELDDVSPGIPCDKNLLEKSDILYVIPLFENASIAENKTWCTEILDMN